MGDLPFEQEDTAKSSRRKKGSGTARRRSIRLAKKPQVAEPMEVDPPKENKSTKRSRRKAGDKVIEQRAVLQEMQIVDENTMNIEPPTEESAFTNIKTQLDDLNMDLSEQYSSPQKVEEENCKPRRIKKRAPKDTPMFGRKRASRITDKENDEPSTQVEEKVPPSTELVTETTALQQVIKRTVLSSNNGIKITKKIKQLYLNKGPDIKKHKPINLETIFESPVKKASGTPLKVIGGKKLKRCVAFTETPWLGRPGKTKGRKVKKGKQVKRVLSSKRERCWKLDSRLSSLDELSP